MLYAMFKNAFQYVGIIPKYRWVIIDKNRLAVSALGNVAYLIKYRRPYAADLWIGSMSVFKKDYECTMISDSKNII